MLHVNRLLRVDILFSLTSIIQSRSREQEAANIAADDQEIWREQKYRLNQIQSVCNRLNITRLSNPPKTYTERMLVDDTNGILFAYIPKVSCSTWKSVFRKSRDSHRENRVNYSVLSQYNDTERVKRLDQYKKVLFVRNPFTRLLSAFLSKFRSRGNLQKSWEIVYGFPIIKRYRPPELFKKLEVLPRSSLPQMNITLTEFIRYIHDRGDEIQLTETSDHWLPQHIVSHVCEMEFDFIGKYENLALEAPFVLKWSGMSPVATFPEVHASNALSVIRQEFGEVPLLHLKSLIQYYSLDFELFGYNPYEILHGE
ncbi:putative carbohydrate sulfotransferase 14 [Apostichopus japonicus]|uniref:Carbohydrate sulfotransferase n=1 Tax=Stichopus japonicus TaxID=307972 RepID=A0A2G8JKN2_STIJA|nr:putative carbohydrate sulfotransferase 14 [Apostichopus japonicus]